MTEVKLGQIAHARSGDKGDNANIGVIAYTDAGYHVLRRELTADRVSAFFQPLGPTGAVRYELPNLQAFNFVLKGVLGGGGSQSLRIDAQGKALGQALLEMSIDLPTDLLPQCLKPGTTLGASDADNTIGR